MPKRGCELWRELIREYESGDRRETQTAFARRRGVSVGTFRLWLYRVRRERTTGPALVPVRVLSSTAPTARWRDDVSLELELPSGVRLRFPVGTDGGYLAALVARLIG